MKRRVVVTGLGVVSCFGTDVDQFYQSLLEGKSGVGNITAFPCEEYPARIAATVRELNPEGWLEKKQVRRFDPYIVYAIIAAKKALAMAGVEKSADQEKSGVVIGSGMGGMHIFVDGVHTLAEKGPRRVTPFFIPYVIPNMASGLVAQEMGFMGPNYSVSSACATGNHAIIAAAHHIRQGEAELMVCGGVEAPILPMGLAGFCAARALSYRNDEPERASRPWDRGRDGFVMGEGAGILVLESLERAKKRKAPILAEYLGGGLTCDGYHMTEPRPDGRGVISCVRQALKDADLSSDSVDYINAHATSTPAGDMAEVGAIRQLFSAPEKIAMNGTKSMIGHALGAAAAIEAVVVVKTIINGFVHPTINLEDPEEKIGFFTPTEAVKRPVRVALSNAFGFGGHNAAILLGRYGS